MILKAGLILLVLVWIGLVLPMRKSIRRQKEQAKWPRVLGMVTAHRVSTRGDTGFQEYQVRYTYDGKDYEAFCGQPDGVGHTAYTYNYKVQRAVATLMARKPVGQPTEIMINPANPAQAYVVIREFPALAIAIATSVVFLAFFVVIVYASRL